MAKVLSTLIFLSSTTHAFVPQPFTSSRCTFSSSPLKMKEIEVVSQPDKDFLEKKGWAIEIIYLITVSSLSLNILVLKLISLSPLSTRSVFYWGTWGCGVSKFPWTYDQNESCYLLAGKVTVIPDDSRLKPATFGKGDFVTFPAGMSCTWDVSEAVQKHFTFF